MAAGWFDAWRKLRGAAGSAYDPDMILVDSVALTDPEMSGEGMIAPEVTGEGTGQAELTGEGLSEPELADETVSEAGLGSEEMVI